MADELKTVAQEWLNRIKKREEEMREGWWGDASASERAYINGGDATRGKVYDFPIHYANVETIVPAVFNSMPQPDIRERFRQGDGPARTAADVLERVVSVQTDDSALDVEAENVARDAVYAGRGVLRVRFKVEEYDGAESESVCYEAVSWRNYIEPKTTRFDRLPWMAFKHPLATDELERMTDKEIIEKQEAPPEDPEKPSGVVTVFEIWCKKKREVLFIRSDDGRIIRRVPDPLNLRGFFPVCKPVQPLTLTDNRDPVVPFTLYQKLADEVDDTTKRIKALLKGLKVRGLLVTGAEDVERLAQAGDNQLVTGSNLEALAQLGMDKAILWWPIERIIAVLRELYVARDASKQAIYEVTGISDIVRGASNTAETATAQAIKTQWGSLRIRRLQSMIERMVRDAYVMTVELIAANFSRETLESASGMQIDDEVWELIQDPLRSYRIDVESDSTVRADLSRQKGEMAEFLNGTAQFFSVMQPVVTASPSVAGPVVALYASFARQFNLGRQAESALDELIEMAKGVAQQEKPNPEAEAKAAEMKLKVQELQDKAQLEAAKLGMDKQRLEMDRKKLTADMQLKGLDALLKRAELGLKQHAEGREDFKAEVDAEKAAAEIVLETEQKRGVAIDGS